jgi:hypothetical protein
MSDIAIHIHEDDWGIRNLYPVAAIFGARADVARATEAGERNRAPDGIGWTDMHVITPPQAGYADTGLDLAAVSVTLGTVLPRVRKFTATATAGFDLNVHDSLGHYDEDAHCYGFDRDLFIKADPTGSLVQAIWFEARTADAARLASLKRAILAIDALVESVIADYWMGRVGRVRDAAFLERYFRDLLEPLT